MLLKPLLEMAGHIRFHSRPNPEYLQPYARDAVEFGYVVFEPHRRRGYATEAADAVMRWAEARHGVRRFVATVSPDNLPSLAMVKKLGFRKIGEHVDDIDGVEEVFLRDVDMVTLRQ